MMNCLTHVEELTEGLRFLVMLSHVIFTEAFIDKLASLVDKIACSSGKLREPRVELMLGMALNETVQLTQLLQVLV